VRVIVGRIGRPHGIHGEVVIGVRTDEPDLRFAAGATLGFGPNRDDDPPADATLRVTAKRWHSGQLLVAFAGITDRTAAGELTGSWLSVDSSQLPAPPDPDEFRDHELIGLSVRTRVGQEVGVVTDVLHYGQDLLVVRHPQGEEYLVPFVRAIVPEVDVAAGLIVIDPPPGLLDLAQAE
jgi:16S rRNA processing protein RimM